jgi:tetratricopeptide (TPR) repeat protein
MSLGAILMDNDEPAQAESSFREAYEIRSRALGPEHRDTLVSLRRIGWTHLERGQLAEAEPYYAKTLEKRRQVLGETHEHTLIVRRQLAGIWRDLGRFEDAEALARETLRLSGEDRLQEAWAHHCLGKILLVKGEPGEAETHLRQALAIGRDELPSESSQLAEWKELLEACLEQRESASVKSP